MDREPGSQLVVPAQGAGPLVQQGRYYQEKYEELRHLGAGASGTCMLVRERRTNTLFAVKKILKAHSNNSKEHEGFRQAHNEVSVLAALSCPNIIDYVESFEEDSTFHIVMEFASQGSLKAQIEARQAKSERFQDAEVTTVCMQLLLALEHLHERKILHRDLKTDNVFITTSVSVQSSVGYRSLVKLGDFGVSRVMGTHSMHAKSIVGTPQWLSPEVVEGKPYNEKCDIWALGCILYELCTLRRPFTGELMQVVYAIVAGKYAPLGNDVNPFFRTLIQCMLQVDPEQRPSVEQLLRLVEKQWGSPELWDDLEMNAGRTYADVYEELRGLGRGSSGGGVLLVRRRFDNQLLAVKKIPSAQFGDWRQRERCHSEVRLLMGLEHSNIVQYMESFEERGVLHLVTDYSECGNLLLLIEQRRSRREVFTFSEVLDLIAQIMLALEYLHSKKILHRDLKPANVFLSAKAGAKDEALSAGSALNVADYVVKLGDFGFARQLSTSTMNVKTTIGTPFYMSPELVQASGYNDRSDVWALGCIAYELLALEKPFPGNSLPQVVLRIAKGTFEPLPSTVPAALVALVTEMLTLDPKKRPSIKEMLARPVLQETCAKIQSKLKTASLKQYQLAPSPSTPTVNRHAYTRSWEEMPDVAGTVLEPCPKPTIRAPPQREGGTTVVRLQNPLLRQESANSNVSEISSSSGVLERSGSIENIPEEIYAEGGDPLTRTASNLNAGLSLLEENMERWSIYEMAADASGAGAEEVDDECGMSRSSTFDVGREVDSLDMSVVIKKFNAENSSSLE